MPVSIVPSGQDDLETASAPSTFLASDAIAGAASAASAVLLLLAKHLRAGYQALNTGGRRKV